MVTSVDLSWSPSLRRAISWSICDFKAPDKRFKTRCRFAVLLPLSGRRSTMTLVTLRIPGNCGSLAASHRPPFDLTAYLRRRVAARLHPGDERLVLLLILGVALGKIGHYRQQIVGGGEHALLDDFTQFLIAGPNQFLTVGLVLRAQHVIDDFVAEVFGVADTG